MDMISDFISDSRLPGTSERSDTSDDNTIHKLAHQLGEEAKALCEYTVGISQTDDKTLKSIFTELRSDELAHAQKLVIALTEVMGGHEPTTASNISGFAVGSLVPQSFASSAPLVPQSGTAKVGGTATGTASETSDDANYKGGTQIVINCTDNDGNLQSLLEYIQENGGIGHTFNIVVDPGDPEREKKFEFDGDGSDRIYEITVSPSGPAAGGTSDTSGSANGRTSDTSGFAVSETNETIGSANIKTEDGDDN